MHSSPPLRAREISWWTSFLCCSWARLRSFAVDRIDQAQSRVTVRAEEHTLSLTQCPLLYVIRKTHREDASSLLCSISRYFRQLLIFKLFSCIFARHALAMREGRKIRELESGGGCCHGCSKGKNNILNGRHLV